MKGLYNPGNIMYKQTFESVESISIPRLLHMYVGDLKNFKMSSNIKKESLCYIGI